MYYSEPIRMSFPAILMLILVYLVGFSPIYISFKLGNRVLLAISVICGLLSPWMIPPVVCMLVVCLQIPVSAPLGMDKRIPLFFWIVLFGAFSFLPTAGIWGINLQGYHLLGIEGFDILTTIFYLCLFSGVITALLLKGRALYISQMIVIELSLGIYMFLAGILFGFDYIVKSGPYITIILLFLGTAGMLYKTYKICSVLVGTPIVKEDVIANLKSAEKIINNTTGRVRRTLFKVLDEGTEGLIKKCANCGSEIKENHTFCPQCGKKIIKDPKIVTRYQCSSCGTFVNNKSNYCGLCGGRVGEVKDAENHKNDL